MSLPDQTPKLPKLPFLIGDAVLLAAAWFIYAQRRHPLDAWAIVGVVACVAVGVFLAAIPFLSDYARKQDEALDERQRSLEALSRTVATSAEQISIAANGLHEIADLAHKNLKHAEQLPQKLHEQIATFTAQLDNAREDDREELEKELAELRASETERLEAAAEKVQKAVADLGKLDAAVQKHLTARSEFLQQTADAISRSHTDAAVALADATAAATRELATAHTKAAADIDTRLADRLTSAQAALDAAVKAAQDAAAQATAAAERTAALLAHLPALPPPAAPAATTAPSSPPPAPESAAVPAPDLPPPPHEIAAPPKRARKTRREEPPIPAEPSPAPAAENVSPPEPPSAPPAPASTPAPEPESELAPAAAAPEPTPPPAVEAPLPEPPPATGSPAEPPPEPAPIPLASIPVIEPVTPASADPFPPTAAPAASEPASTPAEATPALSPEPEPTSVTSTPPPAPELAPATPPAAAAEPTPPPAPPEPPVERPARKRPRKLEPDTDFLLDLGHHELSHPADSADESSQESPADAIERVISSDGATRLIATAYIGIGNRLFIRGDGPGLSWEKGVPLQFVSIGKWRWETSDAAAPIAFKLYKNDELECASLGRLTLEPGHQQEVTAKF